MFLGRRSVFDHAARHWVKREDGPSEGMKREKDMGAKVSRTIGL